MLSRYIESSMNYVKYLQFYMLGNAGYSYQLSTMFFLLHVYNWISNTLFGITLGGGVQETIISSLTHELAVNF